MSSDQHTKVADAVPAQRPAVGARYEQIMEACSPIPNALAERIVYYGQKEMHIGAWEFDLHKEQFFWTAAVFHLFDLEGPETPKMAESMRYYLPEDRQRLNRALASARNGQGTENLLCRLISAKRRLRIARISIHPVKNHLGIIDRLQGISHEVTSSYLSERGIEALFQSSPYLVAALDPTGRPIQLSPSWGSVLGLSHEDVDRHGLAGFIHEEERSRVNDVISETLQPDVFRCVDCRLEDAKGDWRWFHCHFFSDSDAQTVFLFANDIDNAKRSKTSLLELRREQEADELSHSDLLAAVAKEFHAPLEPIIRSTQQLLEADESGSSTNLLSDIQKQIQQLSKIVLEVLDFAKVESAKIELHETVFDAHEFIEKIVANKRRSLESDAVELSHTITIGNEFLKSQKFIGDTEKIANVLNRLIDNAISMKSIKRISIKASVFKADHAAILHAAVIDDGVGLLPSERDHVFRPIPESNAGISTTNVLSLSICKNLIEYLGGSIKVKSAVGEGSVFSFQVPLRLEARADLDNSITDLNSAEETQQPISRLSEPDASPTPTEVQGDSSDEKQQKQEVEEGEDDDNFNLEEWKRSLQKVKQPHVLLVEDNRMNILFAKNMLRNFYCDVTVATSGEQALGEYSVGIHELVLLDLHMAGIGGMEVLRVIRRNESAFGWKRVPIIILTADVSEKTKCIALDRGADTVLHKPIRPKDLAKVLSGFIGLVE